MGWRTSLLFCVWGDYRMQSKEAGGLGVRTLGMVPAWDLSCHFIT